MPETPRQYKKTIDEKRQRNEKNKEKLIEKIEKYDLLDERFKTQTKQQILDNFEKNQKAEQEGEQYKIIVSELENVDKKYDDLEAMKNDLILKKEEKSVAEQKIRSLKLDGVDETTLKIQMAEVRRLKEKHESLNTEIKQLEKDITNREKELKELERTYGVKSKNGSSGGKSATDEVKMREIEHVQAKPATLKEFHEQTIQDLWNKDRVRSDIFQLLEAGTGIDDSLKEKIKKEISDRFFEYYDEKRSSLRMKSAKFVKNKLKTDSQYNDIWHKVENEKSEKNVEKRKMGWLSSIITRNKIQQNLKSFRQAWEERINNIYNYSKEKIIKAAENIPVKVETESDGSRLIEFKLGNKTYKILDPKLKTHSDDEYFVNNGYTFIRERDEWVKLGGMRGDDVNKRKNKKLKKYVQQKEKEGLHIAKIEEMKAILAELGEKAELDSEEDQIAMLMYLTGMDGWYWLSMGDDETSGSQYSRSLLFCLDSFRWFDYFFDGNNDASLCMIACN